MPAFKKAIEDVLQNDQQRSQVMSELGISTEELAQLDKASGKTEEVDPDTKEQ